MSAALPLIDQVGRLIERTYDFDAGVGPLGRFVVGDLGHARLIERQRAGAGADVTEGAGARLLLRPLPRREAWAAALYLPDALIETLERHDPRREIGGQNVGEFATLVEEVDHLLTFADRVRRREGPLSLLELEWHAGVTKYLVLTHFIARLTGRRDIGDAARSFVERYLFPAEYSEEDPAVRARYRDADRFAIRLIRALRPRSPSERLRLLRRFHRANHHEKMREFARLPVA
ncbi:MAG: hypothetical protein D6718_07110 [Acidobacteria bacterium]|nr:MAG: hypothetical protein D6718_07110 [Acidobacteriota bacterium]